MSDDTRDSTTDGTQGGPDEGMSRGESSAPFTPVEKGLLLLEGRLLETGEEYDEATDSMRSYMKWVLGEGADKIVLYIYSSSELVCDAMGDEFIDKHQMARLIAHGPYGDSPTRTVRMHWMPGAKKLGHD